MINQELIKKIKNKLTNRAAYDYFFNSLQDPAWIMPLFNAGFFTSPDDPIKEGDTIGFPNWSESNFLLRMADKAPDDVFKVVESIPDTKNQRVLEDILQILLKVDAKKSVKLAARVVNFLDVPFPLRIQNFTADLAAKLADAGHIGASITLIEKLLEVKPDPRIEKMNKDELQTIFIEPRINYSDYDYQEIINKILPSLVKVSPREATNLFCRLLDKTIEYKLAKYSGKIDDDEGPWEDYSTIWRPDIATVKHLDQPRDGLISALRDSLIALMNSDMDDKEKLSILKEVSSKKFKVFGRITEFTLREYKDIGTFKSLYQKVAPKVSPITDKAILEKDPYEIEPDAGITFEKLAALSDDDLIDTLKSHEPTGVFFWRDNMADLFQALIKSDVKRYVSLDDKISKLGYLYVNSYLSAISEKVDDLNEDDFIKVLNLGKVVLTQKFPQTDKTEHQYFEWSKMALARFCDKLVVQRNDGSENISKKSIGLVSDVLLVLVRDPDPDPSTEKQNNLDPPTLSLNTIRGEAMHGIIRLLFWIKRNKTEGALSHKIYGELEWHLDTKNDHSSAIRAVYGQWFPWIWNSNKSWAEKNMDKIFSDDRMGVAAWYAYITLNQVYNELVRLTDSIVRKRINDLKRPAEKNIDIRDARDQFTKHIMIYYWHGLTDLTDHSIAKLFFETANVQHRKEALHFIGFELGKESPVSKDILERLIKLWEYRLNSISKDVQLDIQELEEFGGWFASGKFDDSWSLSNLDKVLKITHNANPDYKVIEKLAEMSADYPLETINCLREMIIGARERWSISSWEDFASKIISNSYKSQNEVARKIAIDQANKLVAKGYHSFRKSVQ